jgi:pyruvate formate lyase activating enzyme
MKIRIGGVVDLSTVDYSGHLTFMIFAAGCAFRCPYCQNAGLIPMNSGREIPVDAIKSQIKENLAILDAVGFSGGEPALQPEPVTEIFRWAKEQNLKTFLNTNGVNPELVDKLIAEKLLDCVALSVIAPLNPQDYGRVMGLPSYAEEAVKKVKRCLEICLNSPVTFEARTTIVPKLVDDEQSVRSIASSVKGCDLYVLQQYDPRGDILDPSFKKLNPPPRDHLIKLARAALDEGLTDVRIRTSERGEEKISP